jgi:hypothetical protein
LLKGAAVIVILLFAAWVLRSWSPVVAVGERLGQQAADLLYPPPHFEGQPGQVTFGGIVVGYPSGTCVERDGKGRLTLATREPVPRAITILVQEVRNVPGDEIDVAGYSGRIMASSVKPPGMISVTVPEAKLAIMFLNYDVESAANWLKTVRRAESKSAPRP